MATVAEEEYLERIYWLEEAELPITGANIARAMQVSAPTVHEMVGRLIADGFITRNSDKSLAFTEQGRRDAAHIVRRHRRRDNMPARPPVRRGHARAGRPARGRRARGQGHGSEVRERGRGHPRLP